MFAYTKACNECIITCRPNHREFCITHGHKRVETMFDALMADHFLSERLHLAVIDACAADEPDVLSGSSPGCYDTFIRRPHFVTVTLGFEPSDPTELMFSRHWLECGWDHKGREGMLQVHDVRKSERVSIDSGFTDEQLMQRWGEYRASFDKRGCQDLPVAIATVRDPVSKLEFLDFIVIPPYVLEAAQEAAKWRICTDDMDAGVEHHLR